MAGVRELVQASGAARSESQEVTGGASDRMLDHIVRGLDGQTLQGLGNLLFGLATLITTVTAVLNRAPIGRAFGRLVTGFVQPRILLVTRAEQAELGMHEAVGRAVSAESAATNWKSSYDALERRMSDIEQLVAEREAEAVTEKRALVLFLKRVMAYATSLEMRLVQLDSSFAVSLPEMPPEIRAMLRDAQFEETT